MVKTLDEIINDIKNALGENATSDTGISLIENVSDTFTDASTNSSIDWKEKYEQNDKEWRNKYVTRFSQGTTKQDENEPPVDQPKDNPPEEEKPTKFEELFNEKGAK